MTTLYAIANTCHGRVINTSNASEKYIGYSTKYGDTAGDVSLFGNLYATEVIEIGKALINEDYCWIGALKEIESPDQILRFQKFKKELMIYITKEPADGLTGKTDKENLGFSYKELDDSLTKSISFLSPSIQNKISSMHRAGLHKINPIPTYILPLKNKELYN